MGLIKEPKGVYFTVGQKKQTKEDEKAFSDYFKKLKEQKSNTNTNNTFPTEGK